MALTIVKFVYPTGSEQNFVGNEVEEKWTITGDGVGASPDLKPKRMRRIDFVDIIAIDGTDITFTIDNSPATGPKVTPVIPAGISGAEQVYVTLRGPFA